MQMSYFPPKLGLSLKYLHFPKNAHIFPKSVFPHVSKKGGDAKYLVFFLDLYF